MQILDAKAVRPKKKTERDNQNISKALFYLAQESLRAGNYDLAASIIDATHKSVPVKKDFQQQPRIALFLKSFMEASPAARDAFLEYAESTENL